MGISAFCFMCNLFSVEVFHRSMVNWRREPWYMCMLLFVKLFGVVVSHKSMVNWRGVHLPSVYVYSAICETYLV